jgi:hypothetical protein
MWPLRTVTQQRERLRGIFRTPAPVRRDHPERDMGKEDDRRRSGFAFQIIVEPGDLVRPERAEAVFLEVDDVDERYEMNAAVVERIPAAPGRALAEALEIGGPRG